MIDLTTLRSRLDLPATVVSDEELTSILSACREVQAERVVATAGGYAALDRALVRRVGREVAARGMPLGAQATEFGSFYIPSWSDPILESLEGPWLAGGFA
jgi:hypothetical protein